jgi:type I restriction enzyme S subunit
VAIERVRVGEVLALQRREVTIDPTKDYRLIGIFSFGKGIFHRSPVAGAELGDYRFFAVKPGDLVLSNIQAWEGAIARATKVDAGTIGTHRFLTYVPVAGRIDTNWARWFLLSEPGMALIRRAAPGSTMRNRTLSMDRFEALEIPLPPIAQQRRVAGRLNKASSTADFVMSLGERTTKLASALRSSLTGGGSSQRGHRAGTWRRVALRDALQIHCHEVKVDARYDYAIAGVYSFGRGLFARAELNGSQTSYKVLHQLRAGQLVMSRLKAWEGALALVSPQFDGWFLSPEFPTFDIDTEQLNPMFLSTLLTSEYFWARLKDSSKGIGARKERVSAAGLLEQVIEVPTIDEQRKIAQDLESIATIEENAAARLARVSALLPSIMNREFTCVR